MRDLSSRTIPEPQSAKRRRRSFNQCAYPAVRMAAFRFARNSALAGIGRDEVNKGLEPHQSPT